MTVFDEIALAVDEFMNNANDYANAIRGRKGGEQIKAWVKNHTELMYHLPFFRSVEGKDHTMFVIDVDVYLPKVVESKLTEEESRILKLSAVLDFFSKFLKETKHKFLVYISGKGLYLVQKYPEPIPKRFFYDIVWNIKEPEKSLFKPCSKYLKYKRHTCDSTCDGFFQESGKKITKIYNYAGINVRITIDLNMYSEGRRLFRAPYSPYLKGREPKYCVPVIYKEDGSIDIDRTIGSSLLTTLQIERVKVPLFDFEVDFEQKKMEEIIRDEAVVREPIMSKGTLAAVRRNINRIPLEFEELGEESKRVLLNMRKRFSDDPKVCPPCIYNHFLQKTDRFWSRMILVRYLLHKGYTVNDIAKFIRFFVNDEKDNAPENRHKLALYMPYAVGDVNNPYLPPSCEKMSDPSSEFYGMVTAEDCLKCGRTYCLEEYRETTGFKKEKELPFEELKNETIKGIFVEKIDKGFEKINKILSDVVDKKEDALLVKSTRCGVTTSLVKVAKEKKKRLLVVAPTNAIGFRTINEAINIIKEQYNKDINAAIIANNLNSCLKLKMTVNKLKEKFKGQKIAYVELPYHNKPPCIDSKGRECKYFKSNFSYPFVDKNGKKYAVGKSSGDLCAYATILNYIDKFDVFFITYDKLKNIVLMEDNFFRQFFLDYIDIIFLDEISHLVQKSPINFVLISEDVNKNVYNFLDEVSSQLVYFKDRHGHKLEKFIKSVEYALSSFYDFIDDLFLAGAFKDSFTEKIENWLEEEERMNIDKGLSVYHSIIENMTKKENLYLRDLDLFINLITSNHFYINNIQTLDYNFICSVTTEPTVIIIRDFLREFKAYSFRKQILVTDATLPFINLSDILGLNLKKVIVGDPRETNKKQLVVADTVTISLSHFYTKFSKTSFKRLKNFLVNVLSLHNPEDVMIVAPSSGKIYKYLIRLVYEGVIDRKVKITYFRSDMTVGVSSKRRIMITILTPFVPPNSYRWLALYYKELNLYKKYDIPTLTELLDKCNAYQTFYQTIGRVKDPEAKRRSIVYTYGLSKKDIEELLKFDEGVSRPHIVSYNRTKYSEKFLKVITNVWLKYGYVVDEEVTKFIVAADRIINGEIQPMSKVLNRAYLKKDVVPKVLQLPSVVLSEAGLQLMVREKKSSGRKIVYVKKVVSNVGKEE